MDETTKVIDGQLYWHISKLHEWDKNKKARTITESNFNKLKDDIALNGIEDQFKIDENGTVYDGNNRLRALQHLASESITQSHNGRDLSWVPVKIEYPQTETDKWKIAFKRNGHYASWDAEGLNNFMPEFEDSLDLSNINIDFKTPRSIEETLEAMEQEYERNEQAQAAQKEKGQVNPNVENKSVATCPSCGHEFEV